MAAASPAAFAGILLGAAHTGGSGAPSQLYVLCPSTGAGFAIGWIGFDAVGGLDVQPSTGVLYGVAKRATDGKNVLITIDPVSGQGREIGLLLNTATSGGGGHFDLSFRPSDAMLFLTAFRPVWPPAVGLFTVDTNSGMATELGDTTTASPGNALAFSASGTLYHANNSAGGTLFIVDQRSGVSAPSQALSYAGFPMLTNPRLNAMDMDPDSGTAWASLNDGNLGDGPSYLATLELTTGSVTHVGTTVSGLDAIAWLSDASMLFGQTIRASASKGGFEWTRPVAFEHAQGSFIASGDIGDFAFDVHGAGAGASLPAASTPDSGEGAWYLLRLSCPEASWSSGGPGECPPGACAGGARDATLP